MSRLLNATPIFLLFSVLIIYWQYAVLRDAAQLLHISDSTATPLYLLLELLTAMLVSFGIPVLYSKVISKVELKALGLTAPKITLKTLLLTAAAFSFFTPSLYLLLFNPSMKNFYTFESVDTYGVIILTILSPLYYFTEEFFFRGFLFFNLWQRVKWNSFWITDIIFTLCHIGKPGVEILFCIPASVAFNLLTLYTKSIYPAVLVHSCMGIFCIIFANYA